MREATPQTSAGSHPDKTYRDFETLRLKFKGEAAGHEWVYFLHARSRAMDRTRNRTSKVMQVDVDTVVGKHNRADL